MPAVAVSVFNRDHVLFQQVNGVPQDAWWDLASVTKILVTLPEVLQRLDLDAPLASLWRRARGKPVGRATVRQLLAHNAGLPAIVPFFQTLSGREPIAEAALHLELEREPGTEPVYSDSGFLLLGELVQELSGQTLADLAKARTGLRFGPITQGAVPTEQCPWRGRLIVGEVHDENAYAMGGIAGHAGAFGTLRLVTSAARTWFTSTSTGRLTQCQAANGQGERFGLGWWLSNTRGLGGDAPGPNAYGCSGFVGNRIWLEPDYGYGVVILSNRVHPVRGDRGPFTAWCASLLGAIAVSLRGAQC